MKKKIPCASFDLTCSIRAGVFLAALFSLIGCSTVPPETRGYQTQSVETKILRDRLSKPVRINERTVILDARKPFDFAMSHAPGSINLSWTEFAENKPPVPGRLKADLSQSALRLSRLGISPETPVVVAGYGSQSSGDEGRLAWTLIYLGVKDVQIAALESLGLTFSNLVQPPPRENAKAWQPVLVSSVLAQGKEVLKIGTTQATGRHHIIDVRTLSEYADTSTRKRGFKKPDLRAVNIPFQEFFDQKGRPNLNIVQRLQSIGIQPDHRIIVLSNNGVRSGAAAFALLSLGFKDTANYAGGWTDLIENINRYR